MDQDKATVLAVPVSFQAVREHFVSIFKPVASIVAGVLPLAVNPDGNVGAFRSLQICHGPGLARKLIAFYCIPSDPWRLLGSRSLLEQSEIIGLVQALANFIALVYGLFVTIACFLAPPKPQLRPPISAAIRLRKSQLVILLNMYSQFIPDSIC